MAIGFFVLSFFFDGTLMDEVLMDEVLLALPIQASANSTEYAFAPPPFRGSAGPFPLHCRGSTSSPNGNALRAPLHGGVGFLQICKMQ